MTWTLTLAAITVISGLTQQPPLADGPPPPKLALQAEVKPPGWVISLRAVAPVTSTDPQHVAAGVGVEHRGRYRMVGQYQPTERGGLGMVRAAIGMRVITRDTWQLAVDLEHEQVRPTRRLFQGSDWTLQGHERHQVSAGMVSLNWSERRFLGLVTGVEAGYGRMQIWRLVSARAGANALNTSPDPVLESGAPVGVIGVSAARALFFGFEGRARFRVIGAGDSRGGEVPFAHVTTEWDVTRQLFQSKTFGRGSLGLVGNHATSTRAVSYFQNGLGLTFRLAF